MCFVGLIKTCDLVDRTLFLVEDRILAWCDVPPMMLAANRHCTSTMECVRASGRMMANVQTGSAWGRAYGMDVCSHPCCPTCSLLAYCVLRWTGLAPINADMVKDMVCTNVMGESGGGGGGEGGRRKGDIPPPDCGGAATDLGNAVCRRRGPRFQII